MESVNGGGFKNGAHGAYTREEKNKLMRVVSSCMTWMNVNGRDIDGYTYGSENIYLDQQALSKLHSFVLSEYVKRYSPPFPFTSLQVANAWKDVRKKNWKDHRDGKPEQPEHYPLFGDPMDESKPSCGLYAAYGRNQTVHRWLVKIGVTETNIDKYLSDKKRQHDFRILASAPGGYVEEKQEHGRWRSLLAEGREWFYPSEALFDYLRREWAYKYPDFETIVAEALSQ